MLGATRLRSVGPPQRRARAQRLSFRELCRYSSVTMSFYLGALRAPGGDALLFGLGSSASLGAKEGSAALRVSSVASPIRVSVSGAEGREHPRLLAELRRASLSAREGFRASPLRARSTKRRTDRIERWPTRKKLVLREFPLDRIPGHTALRFPTVAGPSPPLRRVQAAPLARCCSSDGEKTRAARWTRGQPRATREA